MASETRPGPRPAPFREAEAARGARFGEVAGCEVALHFGPLRRDGPVLRAAREGAAIVDLTPWARIEVHGRDRSALLQRISTNDLRGLARGRAAATLFVTPKGRIVDRALLLDRGESLLLVTAPGGRHRLQDWIRRYTLADDVRCVDVTDDTASFAISGPAAGTIVAELAGERAAAAAAEGSSAHVPGAWRSFREVPPAGSGMLAAPCDLLPSAWLVVGPTTAVAGLHARLLGERRGTRIAPAGVEEAELLRIEAGIAAEGHELTEEQNPWEAAQDALLSGTKGCYTGQEVIARLRTYDKVQRRLVGVRLGVGPAPAVPRPILAGDSEDAVREIGVLTSAAAYEGPGGTIGLGFVRSGFGAPGTPVLVGEERAPASLAALPFAKVE